MTDVTADRCFHKYEGRHPLNPLSAALQYKILMLITESYIQYFDVNSEDSEMYVYVCIDCIGYFVT